MLMGARGDSHADARMDEAQAIHREGAALYERGEFRAALARFQDAYELAPFPAMLFNIARCQEKLGDLAAAILSLERFLVVAPMDAREDAEQRLVELRARRAAAAPSTGSPSPVSPSTGAAPVAALRLAVVPTSAAVDRRVRRRRIAIGVGVASSIVVLGLGLGLGLAERPTALAPFDLRGP